MRDVRGQDAPRRWRPACTPVACAARVARARAAFGTLTPGRSGLGCFTYAMFALGSPDLPEDAVALGLWRALNISVGVAIALVVHLFLLPSQRPRWGARIAKRSRRGR